MERTPEWTRTAHKIYGILRQTGDHDLTMARMLALQPGDAPWITEVEAELKAAWESRQ